MDKDKLRKLLLATFLDELEEYVQALNRDLVALEKCPAGKARTNLVAALLRTAHSLKGASRSMSLTSMEGACHAMEDLLVQLQEGRRELAPAFLQLLLTTVDEFHDAGERLRGNRNDDGALEKRRKKLVALVGSNAQATITEARPQKEGASDTKTRTETASNQELISEEPETQSETEAGAISGASLGKTVRISSGKLDELLARSGEFLVSVGRLDAWVEKHETLLDFVRQWQSAWRAQRSLGKWQGKDDKNTAVNGHGAGHAQTAARSAQVLSAMTAQLRWLETELDRLGSVAAHDHRTVRRGAHFMDTEVRRIRMLPFSDACRGLERTVRDLANQAQKEVVLVIEGGSVELDRSVLEKLKAPLVHMVRNAVDHGVERPEERAAADKPSQARITVSAALRGAQVQVRVTDDGRGLNEDAIRQRAKELGPSRSADSGELSQLIFAAGFSTSQIITDVSGRGVGLDVVRAEIESLHGRVDVSSEVGRGTSFEVNVPLTLTTIRALLTRSCGQLFAFPGTNVVRLIRVQRDKLTSVGGREMLLGGDSPLPIASLAHTLGIGKSEPAHDDNTHAVVVAAGARQMIFVVDELLSEQEIMVKTLGARIRQVEHVSAASVLPDGRIALILNTGSLIRSALATSGKTLSASFLETAERRKRLLIVDDSVTIRTMQKLMFEEAGYDVIVTTDGAEAWQVLQQETVDLVVSDVEMPRMDGVVLTEKIRGSERLRNVPVILVTALGNDRDKARGLEAGADAYLVKSSFDESNLMETIARLL